MLIIPGFRLLEKVEKVLKVLRCKPLLMKILDSEVLLTRKKKWRQLYVARIIVHDAHRAVPLVGATDRPLLLLCRAQLQQLTK